jgi:hypothetical protein
VGAVRGDFEPAVVVVHVLHENRRRRAEIYVHRVLGILDEACRCCLDLLNRNGPCVELGSEKTGRAHREKDDEDEQDRERLAKR